MGDRGESTVSVIIGFVLAYIWLKWVDDWVMEHVNRFFEWLDED